LDCSYLNLVLRIFLDFLGFSCYFSCFKVFSGLFLELLMHWKIFRKKKKKNYPIGLGRARGPDPTRSGPAAPPRPIRPQAAELLRAAAASQLGVRAPA
jgi:hypothetical protein